MNPIQPIPPMPRPDFEQMGSRAVLSYLKKNGAYVSADDRLDTREAATLTAGLVADRKAEDFRAAKEVAEELDRAVTLASGVLQKFPKGPLGLTPDEVKRSPEFITASRNFARAFAALRNFNGKYTKTFADELRYERQIRRGGNLIAG